MKILRKGILPENIIYTGECSRCHCLLECNYNETVKQNLGDRYEVCRPDLLKIVCQRVDRFHQRNSSAELH